MSTQKPVSGGTPVVSAQEGLSVPEAARVMGVTPPTVYRWMRIGSLPFTQFGDGRLRRIHPADLEALRVHHSTNQGGNT